MTPISAGNIIPQNKCGKGLAVSSSLILLGSALGLTEGGVVAVMLGLVFCSMSVAVAFLLRQTYREQLTKPSKIKRKVGITG